MPAPFKVKAVYDYSSPHDDDLNFSIGQIITVTEEEDDDWYTGEYADASGIKQEGIFPRNFVEKYEPEIPSRPSRPSRPKKEAAAEPHESVEPPKQAAPVAEESMSEKAEDDVAPPTSPSAPGAAPPPAEAPMQSRAEETRPVPSQEPASKPASTKSVPPKVAEKPSGSSFKDRIAAFNKPAAAPIAPFKPGGQGGSGAGGFIKKPFVAPPPSKNAYVPPPREPPQKIYRREEEMATTDRDEQKPAEEPDQLEASEDQPKPTSLKDRIALLQKQQLEQAQRNAEKKEKPKKPPKKRVDPKEPASQEGEAAIEAAEGFEDVEPPAKKSVDFEEEEIAHAPRQAVHSQAMATPPPPSRELMSDTNDADHSAADDTEDAEDLAAGTEEAYKTRIGSGSHFEPPLRHESTRSKDLALKMDEPADGDGSEGEDEEGEAEEEMDPEVRRRMEIRDRMAKMSGGMGMMGMFGAGGGMPGPGGAKKTRSSGDSERRSAGRDEGTKPSQAPPVPIMALPGMSRMKSPETAEPEAEEASEVVNEPERTPTVLPTSHQRDPDVVPDVEDVEHPSDQSPSAPTTSLHGRVPPPPPHETRPAAPPAPPGRTTLPPSPPEPRRVPTIPQVAAPLSSGEDSDDEMSRGASRLSLDQIVSDSREPQTKAPPPAPSAAPPPAIPSRPPRTSTEASLEASQPHVSAPPDRRSSRGPPPVPGSSPQAVPPVQSRPPPPPPPGQPPARSFTGESRTAIPASKHQVNDDSEEEVTEYDGDYDTDIASSAKHKDALKAHGRDSSLDDDGTITDDATNKSPTSPPARGPPPPPPAAAPREVPPPPPPSQPQKPSRTSSDMPRGAPPPIPPVPTPKAEEEDYDPFRYGANYQRTAPPPPPPSSRPPPVRSPAQELEEDEMYGASPPSSPKVAQPPPLERNVPPPPTQAPLSTPPSKPPRQSLEVHRSATTSRRSMEQPRASTDTGFMASDIDLGERSKWWTQENTPPPSLQGRRDILYEMESTSTPKRGNKTQVTKEVFVLYMDYSQTTITATFDAASPLDTISLEQKHDRPPPPLRQDQLESASLQFGTRLSDTVTSSLQNTTVGDGTPHALILELLKPLSSSVLMPVGVRAYGAPVYSNLANASIQQFDEIRSGDIVTFRNAKFQGHRGTIHQKYSAEVGKPDHVGVVVDWDGTKKKIRAWEQGRESRKGLEGGGERVGGVE
ncbi:MAG: hypothetical protein Q9227_002829 [Pyrenula ochraceoflavens]